MLWIEKYRPKDFDDFVGQEPIAKRIKAFVEQGSIPHLMFAGPAGTGKSTLALIIAKKLFRDTWKHNFLELNASDSRGIDVIRNEVKDFARTRSLNSQTHKIIFLDESDALTRDAQQALRRTMETYSNSVRFILSCNYSTKIIDPIQSRCAIFRFSPLSLSEIKTVIQRIAKEEKLKIDEEIYETLHEVSNGDLRRVENILQSCASINKNINNQLVYEIVSAAQPKEVKEVLSIAIKGDFLSARKTLLNTMLKHSLTGLDIIKQIQKEIWTLDISDNKKIDLITKCGEIEFRMVEGADEFIQLEALLASFVKK